MYNVMCCWLIGNVILYTMPKVLFVAQYFNTVSGEKSLYNLFLLRFRLDGQPDRLGNVEDKLVELIYLINFVVLIVFCIYRYVLESEHLRKFFDFIQLPNFDIAADAAATFKVDFYFLFIRTFFFCPIISRMDMQYRYQKL